MWLLRGHKFTVYNLLDYFQKRKVPKIDWVKTPSWCFWQIFFHLNFFLTCELHINLYDLYVLSGHFPSLWLAQQDHSWCYLCLLPATLYRSDGFLTQANWQFERNDHSTGWHKTQRWTHFFYGICIFICIIWNIWNLWTACPTKMISNANII